MYPRPAPAPVLCVSSAGVAMMNLSETRELRAGAEHEFAVFGGVERGRLRHFWVQSSTSSGEMMSASKTWWINSEMGESVGGVGAAGKGVVEAAGKEISDHCGARGSEAE
ncbi:hypothetical protein C8R47DRAFT_1202415 [Mycena vitilis]|nr:hypothetical protein C8R47DRAFT_1202415 [Mycena vitilis]